MPSRSPVSPATKLTSLRNCFLVVASLFVGETLSSIGQDDPPQPLDLTEPEAGADEDAKTPQRLTVTLGTAREEVEALLGNAENVSVIPSLRRAKAVYDDGTEVIYLDGRVISFMPGKDARQVANGNYVVKREGAVVAFQPETLRATGILVGDDAMKREVEDTFIFRAPPNFPAGYGDFPYGPPHVYYPAPWPIHVERLMPFRVHPYMPRYQHMYYPPEPYVVPSPR